MTQRTKEPTDFRTMIAGIITEGRALLRTELQLARQELSDNAARAGGGLALFALALLVALVGLVALSVAAILGIAALGVAYHWAALIVAIACLAIALVFALIGKSRLSASALAPTRTMKQVKSDIEIIKEMSRA
ncbi:phage holin family protein [Marivita sp. XM-24bin2]|uniref:phage holin family protein n=1 Tax=unclassified Marivita TaxID=2632480 RepID=UPI000D78D60B|nr:phage holin family protein [Marivita sp. XM-24bin2]MCR9108869.1 phage holin family protein [Paracoccaceae bacterium]PWL34925.1 MAG: phage holin family protein [Marivita sp. XM-24bin2]